MLVSFYFLNLYISWLINLLFLWQITEQKTPDGSWKCEECGNINYPFRTKCNRQNCGADKPSEETKSPSAAVDGNEQVCGVAYYCVSYWFILSSLVLYISLNSIIFLRMITFSFDTDVWFQKLPFVGFSLNFLKFVSFVSLVFF